MQDLAFSSTDPFVPQKERWIASLSNGRTVFMDIVHGQSSAWVRLRDYLKRESVSITQLRLEAFGRHVTSVAGSEGYWYCKRACRMMGGGPHDPRGTQVDWGIGYVNEGSVHIQWVTPAGHITSEERELKSDDIGIILNP